MSEKYYNPLTYDPYYPTVIQSIFETLRIYICNVLYRDEEFRLAKDRFIQVDFTGGDEASIRRSIEVFKTSQAMFPFTAYGIEDKESNLTTSTHKAKSGTYYSNLFESYIKAIPSKIVIPMVSFFTTASDYERAFQLLESEAAILTRLNVPISINDNNVYFPIDINFEIAKGQFAGQFDEYLKIGNIFGLNHNFTITFHYFLINANDQHGNTPRVAPVDDMIASFYSYNKIDYRDTPTLQGRDHAPNIPAVSSSVPINNAIGIDKTANIILNFNTAMNEASVQNYINFVPFISANYNWDSTSTILTIELVENLIANTQYTITISTDALSSFDQNLENEFSLIFTTGN